MQKTAAVTLAGRRRFLQLAAGAATAGALGSGPVRAQSPTDGGEVIGTVSAYIAQAASAPLPAAVVAAAKLHILDTFAAMVSGSRLIPGQLALQFIRSQAGAPQAQVVASPLTTSAINAAFANAMMAHSDETDDSHRSTLVHPGAAIVPATLAMAERSNASGDRFLKSVVAGYDLGCRMILALGPEQLLQGSGATPGVGGCIGATAACAAVAKLSVALIPAALSYAAQQASGVNSWMRDQEHVEKAFVFAGMPARNGVTAVELVQTGFTGEADPFSGADNFLAAFSSKPDVARLTQGLGSDFELLRTDMKRFPVGFPIQATTDAVLKLLARGLKPQDIRSLTVRLPAPGVHTVNDRSMPDVNVQYIVAATLLDGTLTFDTAHSLARMKDPAVLSLKQRVVLEEDRELTAQKRTREANIEVVKTDGSVLQEHGVSKGAIENPMSRDEVETKARELMTPVLGRERTLQLIARLANLEQLGSLRALRPILSAHS